MVQIGRCDNLGLNLEQAIKTHSVNDGVFHHFIVVFPIRVNLDFLA